MNNGQVNTAARLTHLYIGEPGRFALPLSVYGGVAANYFQNAGPARRVDNSHLGGLYLNPFSGFTNISVNGLALKKQSSLFTRTGLLYHADGRLLNGYKTNSGSNTPALQ